MMNEKQTSLPKVSVLMPVYNVEKYVAEAIESILSQTFTDFELILLDDCSPDKSAEIIKTFNDKRIIYHRNERNLGLADNLNVGLKLAKGKYIARADSDDISLPTRLETQINFLETHPDIDLCSCGLEMFGTENTIWIRENDPEQIKITMMFFSPVLHATSVWCRESFEKNKLYYDQSTFPAEDYDLWSRAIFFCKLINIPQVLYRYRIHGIQVTKTDDRVDAKDSEIRMRYLEKALPSLKSEYIRDFNYKFIKKQGVTIDNVKSLKIIYKALIEANDKEKFFDRILLEKQLKNYYRNFLMKLMKDDRNFIKNIRLFADLNLKKVIKILTLNMRNPLKLIKKKYLQICNRIEQIGIDQKLEKSVKKGFLAVNIKNDLGFGAKLIWVLEILKFCDDRELKPYFKFTYKNDTSSSSDYFTGYFNCSQLPDNKYIEIKTISQLKLGENYNKMLNVDISNALINKYLSVKEQIKNDVDTYYSRFFINQNVLGVHYRGTDKINEASRVGYEKVLNVIHYCLINKNGFDKIYVSTDDNNFLNYLYQSDVSKKVIAYHDSYRSSDSKSIHSNKELNKYDVNKDALINILLLSKCDFLIKSTSIMSAVSLLMNPSMPFVMLNRPYDNFMYFPEMELLQKTDFDVNEI